jgi:hypothetical protein
LAVAEILLVDALVLLVEEDKIMQQQPMQQQPMRQQPMQQQPMQPPPVSKTTKSDIDSVYEQLRQKNSSAKVESESNNNSRLSTIEEVDEEEDDEPNFDE